MILLALPGFSLAPYVRNHGKTVFPLRNSWQIYASSATGLSEVPTRTQWFAGRTVAKVWFQFGKTIGKRTRQQQEQRQGDDAQAETPNGEQATSIAGG